MKTALTAVIMMTIALPACAQSDESPSPGPAGDHEIGKVFEVTVEDLPQPYVTDAAYNRSQTIPRPQGALPQVPDGFAVTLFAGDLEHPRWMGVAPNGDVFLAESRPGKVTILRDDDRDGVAETRATYVDGLNRPHGIAFRDGYVYIADVDYVRRYPYEDGDLEAAVEGEKITPDGALPSMRRHWTRNIAFNPDGDGDFFITIGSLTNIDEDPVPHATVQHVSADGQTFETFAAGLRNPVGIAFYPGTSDLYVVVNERDGLGDGLVPDYLTRIKKGQFFGWPYSYFGLPEPSMEAKRPDLIEKTVVPDLLFESHSAPLGLVFYDSFLFPPDYQGDAFVALHGSWNRSDPTGYKVVHVPFENGRPAGHYINFVTGFWDHGTDPARVWGRPAGLAIGADGSLLIADDAGAAVWRVTYPPHEP